MQEREAEFQKRQSALAADPSNKHLEQYLTNAQVRLSKIQHTSSRMYAMDIGADQATLRTSYPDCSRFLFFLCLVCFVLEDPRLRGYLAKLDNGAVQATLRTSYPDCSRYLILPCQARLALEDPRLRGYIAKLDNSAVHVPLEYRAVITGTKGRGKHATTRCALS